MAKGKEVVTVDTFNIEDEQKRFNELETSLDSSIVTIDRIINIFAGEGKTEMDMARNSGKIVQLMEQKISLMTRKESIIKNVADLKKNAFTINQKLKDASGGDGNTDMVGVLLDYSKKLQDQKKEIDAARKTVSNISNKQEVEDFFNEN